MTIKISISQLKGGEAKTTTAFNVASQLSILGHRVLLIDLDPQANLSSTCNLTRDQLKENNIYEMIKAKELSYFKLSETLAIIPSHLTLTNFEGEYLTKPAKELILQKLLKPIENDFDFIILDCNPSLGLNVVNAFVVSDYIILPSQAEDYSVDGLENLLDAFYYYKQELELKAEPLGIVLTRVDTRLNLHNSKIIEVQAKFGDLVFDTIIRDNISVSEAQNHKKSIFTYAPTSHGAEDYKNLTNEILDRLDKKQEL
jgi:chromosome partitioning protein